MRRVGAIYTQRLICTLALIHQSLPRRKFVLIKVKALTDSSPPSSDSQPPPPPPPDPVKLALARAKAYKKSKQSNPTPKISQNQNPVSEIPKFQGNKDDPPSNVPTEEAKEFTAKIRGLYQGNSEHLTHEDVDKNDGPKTKISAINFVGLGFADKKEGRGLSAGLVPISDSFPSGDLPDVEIIVGDTSRFGNDSFLALKGRRRKNSGGAGEEKEEEQREQEEVAILAKEEEGAGVLMLWNLRLEGMVGKK
ncbi:hypothetical protein LXL04_038334 [Taraxacum kok-saghyz]